TVDVSRPISVKVRARDASGNYFVRIFKDLSAKAVQHEIDHLRGVLIIDYLNPLRRFMASRKLRSKKCTEVKKNM
ncbi:MAG: peptide deformylase, partial [Candidatus Omnitrophica bacterium]|nr:peptide deformylase [Candidatus Omnitrophota bacterium]